MRSGYDFPDLFSADNYKLRHSTGHNLCDPESIIVEAEVAEGLSYDNSHREWMNEATYLKACSGELTPEQIMYLAPRVENVDTLSDATGHYA
jgi:hypothetical protein